MAAYVHVSVFVFVFVLVYYYMCYRHVSHRHHVCIFNRHHIYIYIYYLYLLSIASHICAIYPRNVRMYAFIGWMNATVAGAYYGGAEQNRPPCRHSSKVKELI